MKPFKNQKKLIASTVVFTGMLAASCSHIARKEPSRSPQSVYPTAFTTLRNYFWQPEVLPDPTAVKYAKEWTVDKGPNGEFVTTLKEFDERGLQTGKPETQPWSGDYWPDRIGGIATRYSRGSRELGILFGTNPSNRKAERRNRRIREKFDELTTEEIAVLSPAEKYDILLGDREFNFTRQVLNGIQTMNDTFGNLPFWNGICNGWSPSSFLLKRPRRGIAVISATGKTVTFYPDDLKALASHLFARSFITSGTFYYDWDKPEGEKKSDQPMYGVRCNVKKPKRDANGSVLPLAEGEYVRTANECADDVNPGVWHLSILNKMGVQKSSFVVDMDYNSPVNNHPVGGYKYEYFNPITKKKGPSSEAVVKVGDYTDDPYRARRSRDAAYIVGIEMEVSLLANTKARIRAIDEEAQDKLKKWTITYDLELDENQRVIGGEWRPTKGNPEYPDFMWYQRPWVWANGEAPYGDEWTGEQVPKHWIERATSGDLGTPYDRPTSFNNGSLVYNRGLGLMERADSAVLQDKPLRIEAYVLGRKYVKACNQHCYNAYVNNDTAAKQALGPLENQITSLHRALDNKNVPKATGATFTRMMYGTLSQRAGDPSLKDKDLEKAARAASYAYDRVCNKYCGAAYNGQARNDAEREEALRQMAVVDAELTRYQEYLDAYGVPMSYPYAQPLAKVVYKLFEYSSDPNRAQAIYLPDLDQDSVDETPDGYGQASE